MSSEPSDTDSKPPISLMIVVFPHSDGPRMVTKPLPGRSKSAPRTAATAPKYFVRPRA